MGRIRWGAGVALVALLAPTFFATGVGSAAGAAAEVSDERYVDVMGQVKVDLADDLRIAAADPGVRAALSRAFDKQGVADPLTALSGSQAGDAFGVAAAAADATVKDFQGLRDMKESSLLLYLVDPNRKLSDKGDLLFGSTPTGGEDDKVESLEVASLDGKRLTVNTDAVPPAPLILIDVNSQAVTAAGAAAISAELRAGGVLSDVIAQPPVNPPAHFQTELQTIKLDDDQEWSPWNLCCPAEIFALTMGGQNGHARVDVVSLDAVNYSGNTYTINRNIVNWDNFSWTAVDFLIMEADATACSTSWSRYASVVRDAVQATASGPSYLPLNDLARQGLEDKDKICPAWVPDSLINLPDYIDSFYGLTKATTGNRTGVSSNARVKLRVVNV